ncbi:MAG: glycosyltransferase [Candidatus Fusobacterium pullicola]|uniref:Glycosyltransferase n=1 Tax=Candidatus Fusobacterium pullicola TaxID=2838601 RepID=A0A9E2NWP2_9FUSO|nr:glycosyltransferase [Candidatus Fusobacterium pullicola]
MKILHITNGIGVGGIASFIEELLYQLSLDRNNEITLLCLEENKEGYREKKLEKVNVIFLNQKSNFSFKNIFKIRKLIKENDIIHAHLFPAQHITVLANLFINKPIVVTEHSTSNNRRKYLIFKIIEKYFIYQKYLKIVCVSQDVKNSLNNWIGNFKNLLVIENGINISEYNYGKNIRQQIFPDIKENDKLICMIARFIYPKDHKTVVKAMEKLPDYIKCVFVGIGDGKEEIEKYVKYKKMENRIYFCGYRSDINNVLKSCDLSVLSSKYEGLSTVVIESIIANTPIIGSNVVGINGILKDKNFLFKFGDYLELKEKILQILTDIEIQNEFKKERKKLIGRFRSENMVKKYQDLYEKIYRKN